MPGRPALPPGFAGGLVDDGFGGIDAVHRRHVAKADEEPHSRADATAEIDARRARANAGLFGQFHRRAEPPDVNLLAHSQFPQIALFLAAIERARERRRAAILRLVLLRLPLGWGKNRPQSVLFIFVDATTRSD